MARRHGVENNNSNLTIGILFCLFIVVLLLGSLALKVFDLIRKSSFSNSERFTIALSDSSVDGPVKMLSFSPDNSSVSILYINKHYQRKEGTKVVTTSNTSSLLGIPVDGFIAPREGKTVRFAENEDKIGSIMQEAFLQYRNLSTNLTILDMGRLVLRSQTISPSTVKVVDLEEGLDDSQIDKISSSLFADSEFVKEKKSIQIINGAEIGGAGTRLARLITNAGGNVVEVSTAKDSIQKSEVHYSGEESYTVTKLSELLKFPIVQVQGKGISDIIIRIGTDKRSMLTF